MSSEFDLEVCHRLPLADAAFRLLDYATNDAFLDGVFDRHRGRSFKGSIGFPLFVHLVSDSLLGHSGSAHQTFRHAQEADSLKASVQAVYGKLRRVPLDLSLGLFAEATSRLRAIGSPAVANPLPKSLAAFWALGFDGKKLKYVRKMLKALRGLKGNIYGGKLLVVQDLATQQAVAVQAVADGEAADNPLVPQVVARVRTLPDERARLWVGDRAFCDFKLLCLLSANGDHFVIRYNTSCGFHPDPSVPVRSGIDAEKRPFKEEWGWLGKPNNPHRTRVRKITVTRANDEPFVVVTSLLDADRYPAIDLLTLYRSRWGIETMFQQVVQTFDLRNLIGATPQATVFQATICLLLYNITLTIRDYVAVGAKREPKTVSTKLLFDDVVRQLTGWVEVVGVDATLDLLRQTPISGPEQIRRYLLGTLGTIWTDRWAKSPTRKRPPKQSPRAYICGGHSSVDKIQRGAHQEIPIKPLKPKERARKANANPKPSETKKRV
jgi:Transposase DDE domain